MSRRARAEANRAKRGQVCPRCSAGNIERTTFTVRCKTCGGFLWWQRVPHFAAPIAAFLLAAGLLCGAAPLGAQLRPVPPVTTPGPGSFPFAWGVDTAAHLPSSGIRVGLCMTAWDTGHIWCWSAAAAWVEQAGGGGGGGSVNNATGPAGVLSWMGSGTSLLTAAVAGPWPTASALAATPTSCSSGSAPRGVLANGNSTGCAAYLPVSTTYAASASAGGPAATALALNTAGVPCSAGNYPLGVDASGNATGCTAAAKVSGTGRVQLPDGSSGDPSVQFSSSTNTGFYLYSGGVFWVFGGSFGAYQASHGIGLSSSQGIRWTNGGDGANGDDSGLSRAAAGLVSVDGDSRGDGNGSIGLKTFVQKPQSAAPATCASGVEGTVYYNSGSHQLCVCNGTAWVLSPGGSPGVSTGC